MLSTHHYLMCLDTWPQLVALFQEVMEPLGWVAQKEVGSYSQSLKALPAAGSRLRPLILVWCRVSSYHTLQPCLSETLSQNRPSLQWPLSSTLSYNQESSTGSLFHRPPWMLSRQLALPCSHAWGQLC